MQTIFCVFSDRICRKKSELCCKINIYRKPVTSKCNICFGGYRSLHGLTNKEISIRKGDKGNGTVIEFFSLCPKMNVILSSSEYVLLVKNPTQ